MRTEQKNFWNDLVTILIFACCSNVKYETFHLAQVHQYFFPTQVNFSTSILNIFRTQSKTLPNAVFDEIWRKCFLHINELPRSTSTHVDTQKYLNSKTYNFFQKMSSAEGTVEMGNQEGTDVNEEHVNQALSGSSMTSVTNTVTSVAGVVVPKNTMHITPVKTVSPGKKGHSPTPPLPRSRDMRVHIGMPGNHDTNKAPTVNQLIWFVDYMVTESSSFENNDLEFDFPQDIIHCFNGWQYIISELVREYFADQIKQAAKAGSDMGSCTVETDGDCFIKLVNHEEKKYDQISILVNYSRSGRPNQLEVNYDKVDIPYKTPEEIHAELHRQKTFTILDAKRHQTLKRQNEEKLATVQEDLQKARSSMSVSNYLCYYSF